MPNNNINKQHVRDDFSNAAGSYDAAAIVQHEICDRTLERVDMLKLQPLSILDIGTGTGRSLQGLKSRFADCTITACDFALPMLNQCHQQLEDSHTANLVCNDAEQLPYAFLGFAYFGCIIFAFRFLFLVLFWSYRSVWARRG